MKTENERRASMVARRPSAPLSNGSRRDNRAASPVSRLSTGGARSGGDAFWVGYVRLIVFVAVFATIVLLAIRA